MMARKKRHFIMINLAYFNKFSEYIVWQRPLGMIHIYSRNELEPGRFVYIKKVALEQLWYEWRSKRRRNYRKWCSKSIRGTFPDLLNPDYKNNVLSHFDIDYYEGEKDKAISSIGVVKDKPKSEVYELKYKLSQTKNRDFIAELLGVGEDAVRMWATRYKEYGEFRENPKEIGV
jgi:hypothetical protein